jgi:hypothetical protein
MVATYWEKLVNKDLLAFVVLAVIATSALAEDAGRRYIGIGYGTASIGNVSPSSHPSVFSVTSGYRFNPMLAVEIDWSLFGDFTVGNGVSSASVSASSLQIAAAGTLPVSQDFDLIGKIGLARNMAVGRGGVTIPGRSGTTIMQGDIAVGLGAQYHITPKVDLHVLYYNYGKFENTASPIKASSVSLGMTYNY